MGLFGGSKSTSTSTTKNENYTQSMTSGDLSHGNIMVGDTATINGLYGEDMQAFVENLTTSMKNTINTAVDSVESLANKAINAAASSAENAASVANKAATSNSNLAGSSIAEVARSYQSAYSESTGIIQQLKPVMLLGVAALALVYGGKYLKGWK